VVLEHQLSGTLIKTGVELRKLLQTGGNSLEREHRQSQSRTTLSQLGRVLGDKGIESRDLGFVHGRDVRNTAPREGHVLRDLSANRLERNTLDRSELREVGQIDRLTRARRHRKWFCLPPRSFTVFGGNRNRRRSYRLSRWARRDAFVRRFCRNSLLQSSRCMIA